MKETGIVRTVDRMGRVVIPKEFRKQLDIENEVDSFEIFLKEDCLVLRKHTPHCVFCGSTENCTAFHDRTICQNCVDELQYREEEPQEPQEINDNLLTIEKTGL